MGEVRHEITKRGITLAVRVHPRARREGPAGVHDGRVKIAVRAAPEKGKANARLAEVLAELLGIPKSKVEIIAGRGSREKTVLLEGQTSWRRVARALGVESTSDDEGA